LPHVESTVRKGLDGDVGANELRARRGRRRCGEHPAYWPV